MAITANKHVNKQQIDIKNVGVLLYEGTTLSQTLTLPYTDLTRFEIFVSTTDSINTINFRVNGNSGGTDYKSLRYDIGTTTYVVSDLSESYLVGGRVNNYGLTKITLIKDSQGYINLQGTGGIDTSYLSIMLSKSTFTVTNITSLYYLLSGTTNYIKIIGYKN